MYGIVFLHIIVLPLLIHTHIYSMRSFSTFSTQEEGQGIQIGNLYVLNKTENEVYIECSTFPHGVHNNQHFLMQKAGTTLEILPDHTEQITCFQTSAGESVWGSEITLLVFKSLRERKQSFVFAQTGLIIIEKDERHKYTATLYE